MAAKKRQQNPTGFIPPKHNLIYPQNCPVTAVVLILIFIIIPFYFLILQNFCSVSKPLNILNHFLF